MLLLAPLKPDDDPNIAKLKMNIVARFVDILITRRIWNFRSIAYSTMQYAMFLIMRDIRGLAVPALAAKLVEQLSEQDETFESNDRDRKSVVEGKSVSVRLDSGGGRIIKKK